MSLPKGYVRIFVRSCSADRNWIQLDKINSQVNTPSAREDSDLQHRTGHPRRHEVRERIAIEDR